MKFNRVSARPTSDGSRSSERSVEPERGGENGISPSGGLGLPAAPTAQSDGNSERLGRILKQIATDTFKQCYAEKRISRDMAGTIYTRWMEDDGWSGADRDPLVAVLRLQGGEWHTNVLGATERIKVKARSLPVFDLVDESPRHRAENLSAESEEILNRANVVVAYSDEQAHGMVIGSMNPVAAAVVSDAIGTIPGRDGYKPMVMACRLDFRSWQNLLGKQDRD